MTLKVGFVFTLHRLLFWFNQKNPKMVEVSKTLVFAWFLFVSFVFHTSAEFCKMTGPCSCDFNNWKLDLSPLITSRNISDGPLFSDYAGGFIYNYNPCKPFQSKNCKNHTDLAVNSIDKNGDCLVIGNQKNVSFKGVLSKLDGIYLEYKNAIISPKILAHVHLQCSNKESFKFIEHQTTTPAIYTFKLETIYACQPVNHTLSAGSVILILVMVAVTIYLIGGFLFKHFYLQAQGVEIIPHYTFWSDFPLLVRDGCYFTFRGCQGPSTYEEI